MLISTLYNFLPITLILYVYQGSLFPVKTRAIFCIDTTRLTRLVKWAGRSDAPGY